VSALPANPLAPEQRAVSMRDLAWLVASLLIVVAPHALRAPWWITLLAAFLYAWRIQIMLSRAPLPSRWLLIAVAAAAMLGVWAEYRTLFGRSPGIVLLALFSGLKLLEMRSQRDAAVVAFLCYFLIITNLLSTQSIPTAAAMLVALAVITTTLVGLGAPQRPARANLRTAGLLLAHAAPAALVLFLLFPRVPGPLWGLPQDAYTGVTGLSDNMTPGNIARLVLSDAIAFRVEFEGEPPAHRLRYWRGPVLWDFDGRTWTAGPTALTRFEPPRGGAETFRYEVVLEPHNRNWLFALETAASLPARSHFTADGQLLAHDFVRDRRRYAMTSIAGASRGPDEQPFGLRRALRLPQGSSPRATALAAQWRQQSASDADIVSRALKYFIEQRFLYTLDPALLGRDSVDDFLFGTREGFCEHFASAFAFLMRAAGVPARIVTGYLGGEPNSVDGIFTVRQSDAHAWAEVYLRGRGWVRVDPTSASVPGRLDSGLARAMTEGAALPFMLRPELEWLRGLRSRWEAVAHRWNVWVLGYNTERQRDLMAFVGMPDADWRSLTATLFTILGTITALLLAWSLRRLARPDPVQKAWQAFCRKLAARGVKRAPQEGPRDYSERAARALPRAQRPIRSIGALYIALRYGAQASAQGIAELRRRVRELRLT